MNSQFQHQTLWLDPPGVANNNFNVIRFNDREDAEVVAASIASAFGALSRLYISGEIGCEGARRVLLGQFFEWPVLNPSAVSLDEKERCIVAYRAFRVHPTYELDEMPSDALDAWRALTRAVARAADGRFGPDADAANLADQAIRECQVTVSRRRTREQVALGGRTRGSRQSGGTLASRVRAWTRSSHAYQRARALLTVGPQTAVLREPELAARMPLFGDAGLFDEDFEKERVLTSLLGAGFEAAFPHPVDQREELDELIANLRQMIADATAALVGDTPPLDHPAVRTWRDLRNQVVDLLRRILQGEVTAELA
jgi:hypothetical protein